MNEENKKSKKKILTYYLILGVCILVIAAITVGVVFAVNNANRDLTLDNPDNSQTNNGDNNGGNGNTPVNPGDNTGDKNDDKPVDSTYVFIAPVDTVDVLNGYTFYHNKTLNCYHFHTGIDFAGEEGANVLSCLDGTVESITAGDLLDGNVITLAHENGIKTVYMFIDTKENLKVGDKVARGDVIGTIAKANGSEYKEGAHLHFEVLKGGEAVDPELYLDIDEK